MELDGTERNIFVQKDRRRLEICYVQSYSIDTQFQTITLGKRGSSGAAGTAATRATSAVAASLSFAGVDGIGSVVPFG